jgi:hypothetical protein
MADGKVIHPASKPRIDLLDPLLDGLGARAMEDGFETPQPRGPLAHLGCVVRPPVARATPQAAEIKAKQPTARPLSQIDETAFVVVERHLKSCQLFAESLLDRPEPPVMPRMSIN